MRQVIFDTSVITASSFTGHVHFEFAFPWIEFVKEKRLTAFISTHCMAEVYSNITTAPYQPIYPPHLAYKKVKEIALSLFKVVEFSSKDYCQAMERVARFSLKGGAIYDTLHVQAALKKKLDALITFNVKDFTRLVQPEELQIINPIEMGPHEI